MKDKIILSLKTKYPKLSDARISGYAEKLAAKITDEKDIDSKIDDLNDVVDFASIIKSDEKIAKIEAEKKAAKKQPESAKEESKEEDPAIDDENAELAKKEPRVPAWAKALIESNKQLSADLTAIKSKESQQTIQQKLADRLKDIPAKFWAKRAAPATDEDIEGFVTDVTADYTDFSKDMSDKGFSAMSRPIGGTGADDKKATDKEVDAILDKIKF